jgi:hypothetical protein
MIRTILRVLLILSLLSIPALPVLAASPCDPGIAFYGDFGSDTVNNGTKAKPFQTRAKAEAYVKATTNGGCVIQLVRDDEGDVKEGDITVLALLPVSGVPLPQSVMLMLASAGAVLLMVGGLWLRRRSAVPVVT